MKNVVTAAAVFVTLALGAGVGGYLAGQELALGNGVAEVRSPVVETAAHGAGAVYAANCAGCHGTTAQGGMGPALAGKVGGWSADAFGRAVLKGERVGGGALAPAMPRFGTQGFGGEMPSDAEIEELYTYLKGL